MEKIIITIGIVINVVMSFAQISRLDTVRIDTLWQHTKEFKNAKRYDIISNYFKISGTAHVTTGTDGDDCDSTFDIKCDKSSLGWHFIDSNKRIRDAKIDNPGYIHVEIACAVDSNCNVPMECKGFKYDFIPPRVPQDGALVEIIGKLVIEKHNKKVLEMHPVVSINAK